MSLKKKEDLNPTEKELMEKLISQYKELMGKLDKKEMIVNDLMENMPIIPTEYLSELSEWMKVNLALQFDVYISVIDEEIESREKKDPYDKIRLKLRSIYGKYLDASIEYSEDKTDLRRSKLKKRIFQMVDFTKDNIHLLVKYNIGFVKYVKEFALKRKDSSFIDKMVSCINVYQKIYAEQKPIATGTYGCIYHPPLQCTDEKLNSKYLNDKYITKYSPEDDNEYLISRKLEKIDPESKYFTYLKEEKGIPKVPSSVLALSCDSITRSPDRYIGYFMNYAGTPLYNFLRKKRGHINLSQLISISRHLIEAVKILNESKISHMDLHWGNILVRETKDGFHPTIIDYGISVIDITSYDEVKEGNNIGVHFVAPIFVNIYRLKPKTIRDVYDTFKTELLNDKIEYSRLADEDDYVHWIWDKYSSMGREDYLKDVIMKNIDAIDLHMLGLTLKGMLKELNLNGVVGLSKTKMKILDRLGSLFRKMSIVDHRLKITIIGALVEIQDIQRESDNERGK